MSKNEDTILIWQTMITQEIRKLAGNYNPNSFCGLPFFCLLRIYDLYVFNRSLPNIASCQEKYKIVLAQFLITSVIIENGTGP